MTQFLTDAIERQKQSDYKRKLTLISHNGKQTSGGHSELKQLTCRCQIRFLALLEKSRRRHATETVGRLLRPTSNADRVEAIPN